MVNQWHARQHRSMDHQAKGMGFDIGHYLAKTIGIRTTKLQQAHLEISAKKTGSMPSRNKFPCQPYVKLKTTSSPNNLTVAQPMWMDQFQIYLPLE